MKTTVIAMKNKFLCIRVKEFDDLTPDELICYIADNLQDDDPDKEEYDNLAMAIE